jgi:type 1 glutamine amidotransferase
MSKKALMVWGGWEGHEPDQCVVYTRRVQDHVKYTKTFDEINIK